REDESLSVPEDVAVVPGAGQTLAGDAAPFGSCTRLQQVEEPEPHRLLAHRVAFDFDIGAVPILVENLALRAHQALPAAVAGAVQRRGGLVANRGTGTLARPAVCQVFHDAQLLAGPQS